MSLPIRRPSPRVLRGTHPGPGQNRKVSKPGVDDQGGPREGSPAPSAGEPPETKPTDTAAGRRDRSPAGRSAAPHLAELVADTGADAGFVGLEVEGRPCLVVSHGAILDLLGAWERHLDGGQPLDEMGGGFAVDRRRRGGVFFARLARHGAHRPGRRQGRTLWLGLAGGVLAPAARPLKARDLKGQDLENRVFDCLLACARDVTSGEPSAASPAAGRGDPRRRFPEDFLPPHLVAGTSPAMRTLYRELEVASRTRAPALLVGETGVGKEHLARLAHDASARAAGPFVAVNCAALPAELLEAELFGIAEGIASGVKKRAGIFRQADGGSLLLDEIGELDAGLQAKLLRTLQEGEVRPVGGQPAPVDVRVIAATNVDVDASLAAGRLRSDLYYRLAGHRLQVPALRERRQDIPALVEHFLAAGGAAGAALTLPALRRLVDGPWPGNVRQLEHEVRRLALRHLASPQSGSIDVDALPPDVESQAAARGSVAGRFDLEGQVGCLERRLILEALHEGGSISQAARLLGLSRNGLKQKCRRLAISLGGSAPRP